MEPTKKFDEKDPYSTSHYSTGVEMYDSQGNKHLLSMFFNKTADREWSFNGMVDGKEVTGGAEGALSKVCGGKLKFTVDGKLDSQELTDSNFNFKGGALQGQKIKLNFGDAIAEGGKGLDGSKQYGKNSDLIGWNQDGAAAGTINSLPALRFSSLYSFAQENNVTKMAINTRGRTLFIYLILHVF